MCCGVRPTAAAAAAIMNIYIADGQAGRGTSGLCVGLEKAAMEMTMASPKIAESELKSGNLKCDKKKALCFKEEYGKFFNYIINNLGRFCFWQ